MAEYQNVEKFFEWLKTVLKEDRASYLQYSFVRKGWLEDVMSQCSDFGGITNGIVTFEVQRHLTKSHNPECYTLEVNDIEDENGDWIMTFIF